MQSQEFDVLLKIVLVGASGVGKSALLRRLVDDEWVGTNNPSTIGVDFSIKIVTINGARVKCQIWDTAGQERFHAMTRNYLRNAHAVFYVFDPYDQSSVDILIRDYLNSANRRDIKPNAYEALVATKTDKGTDSTRNDERIVSNLDKFAMSMFWTSSVDGSNVRQLLETVCKYGMDTFGRETDAERDDSHLKIEGYENTNKNGCC